MLRVVCLALATVVVLATAEDEGPSMREVQKKCQEEFKLDEEAIAKLNSTKHLETKDPKLQCFVKCFLTEFKLMNDAGDPTLERLKQVNHPKASEAAEKCGGITGTDPCDKAVNLQNCLMKIISLEEERPPE